MAKQAYNSEARAYMRAIQRNKNRKVRVRVVIAGPKGKVSVSTQEADRLPSTLSAREGRAVRRV